MIVHTKAFEVKVTSEETASSSTNASSQESLQYQDHNYSVTDSPRTLKRKLNEALSRNEVLKKKLNVRNVQNCRLKKKVESLDTIIQDLKNNQKISSERAEELEGSFSGITKEVLMRGVKKIAGKATFYSEEIKAFAMTLQFYSSKAYKYVRKSFDLLLPHPAHIRKWYSKVEGTVI